MKFTCMVDCHSSTEVSATRPGYATPALWIKTSSSTIGSTTADNPETSARSIGHVVAPNSAGDLIQT